MGRISYSVVAVLPDESTRDRYLRWLREGHLQGVIAGGASIARIVALDGDEIRIQTQYEFSDREVFDLYERDFAPSLRAEGRALFGDIQGLRFERTVGEELPVG